MCIDIYPPPVRLANPRLRDQIGPMLRVLLLALAASGALWVVAGDPSAPPVEAEPPVVRMDPEISWEPEVPGEGTLFRVRVQASEHSPLMGVHGQVGPEELHFERLGDRVFESIAAIPVGAGERVQGARDLAVPAAHAGHDDAVRVPAPHRR